MDLVEIPKHQTIISYMPLPPATIDRGSSLASFFKGVIVKKRDPKYVLVKKIEAESGMHTSSIYQVLSGSVKCHPADCLKCFNTVLGTSITSAAECDGFFYNRSRKVV